MIQKVCSILSTTILILVLLILSALLIPRAFGYEIYAVMSGSMEPTYPVGGVVYVQKVSADRIEVDDPIAFKIDNNTIATHRVIKKDDTTQVFYTKGDANKVADFSPVAYDHLIGKATIVIPKLGFLTMNMKSTKGIIISCGIIMLLVILYIIPELLKKEDMKINKKREGEKV